ncbi:MAG: EF-hand domain-containing protein [Planctomycetes bacterium]|nr:EF-hand domain-containing protein [Planctomycetota bacterium]
MNLPFLPVALPLLLWALPAFSQDPPPPKPPAPPKAPAASGDVLAGIDFKAADKDGNGSLSTEELSAAAFAGLDADKDGRLSSEELSAFPGLGGRRARGAPGEGGVGGEDRGRRGRLLDRDGDGFVDASEFRFPMARMADEDGDGSLSAEEFSGFKERAARTGRREAAPPGAKEPPAPPRGPDRDGMLRRLDADGDGAIARSEWKGDGAEFDRLDADKDGRLAGEELRGRPGEGRQRQRPGPLEGGNPMEHDQNADGKLSPKEFSAYLFSRLDADRDGSLVSEDLQGIPFPPRYNTGQEGTGRERLMQDLDHDRDGKVSAAEFVLPERLWRLFDRDRDDFVKADEIPRPGEGRGPGGRRPEGLEIRSVEDALSRMDSNKDGELTSAEWKAPRQFFDRFDGDKDGKLTRTELETGIEKGKASGLIREPDDFLTRHDKNKDGKVTREEFEGSAEAFDRADSNGDGAITAADRPAGTPSTPPTAPPRKEKRRERV